MTFFIKLENNQPVGFPLIEENFRQLFPQFSYPMIFTPDLVEPLGFGIYDFSNQPVRERYKKILETSPVRNENGIWIQTWQIVDKDETEKSQEDLDQAEIIRRERNFKLFESDWTQTLDAPVDRQAWASYRQQLRDVTAQSGFPWEIVWPELPGK